MEKKRLIEHCMWVLPYTINQIKYEKKRLILGLNEFEMSFWTPSHVFNSIQNVLSGAD